jgi:hypothetical protein
MKVWKERGTDVRSVGERRRRAERTKNIRKENMKD